MAFAGLMNWWNLLYLIPFGVAAIYLFIYTLTGVTFGDADMDADAHIDVDADADADGDAEHDAEGAHDGEGGSGYGVLAVLDLLGVGRAPVSLLLMILMILWGVIGLALNQLLVPHLGALAVVISLPVTLVAACALTGILARLIARFMPMTETYSRSKASLVGRRGEAVSVIDEKFGLAAVREISGDLYQVPSRVGPGKPAIAKGAAIVLFDYDETAEFFYVAPLVEGEKLRATTMPRRPRGDPEGRLLEKPVKEEHVEPPERMKS